MRLSLTSYVDRDTAHVEASVAEVAAATVAAMAPTPIERVSADCHGGCVQLSTDLEDLDGATVCWSGDHDLTELRVAVPWTADPAARNQRALTASRFSRVLTDRIRAA